MTVNWITAAHKFSQQGKAFVLVTLIGVSGSTPRNNGTKMVISKDEIFDTIGGGHLEHKTIKYARQLLFEAKDCQHLEHFQLGAHLDQCCGGSANVLFECFSENRVNIALFGAGNVAQALIPILASLPVRITWIDSRATQFPENVDVYENVSKLVSDNPDEEVTNMGSDSYYIVMTHKHQMDFDICHQVFKRGDFSYLGLIGSETKWRRFQRRYEKRGIDAKQLQRMSCPIGLDDISGKLPVEIAVSVAGQVIKHYQQNKSEQKQSRDKISDEPQLSVASKHCPSSQQGVHWKTLKLLRNESGSTITNDE